MKKMKATMYWQGSMMPGLKKLEMHLIEVGTRQYAQYANAPYCRFRPKRARKDREIDFDGYRPWVVVVEGWDHPDFQNWRAPQPGNVPGIVVRGMKYSMCDERWCTDGDQFVEALKAGGAKVLADYRHTQGFNPNNPKVTS